MWRERNQEHPNYARMDYVWQQHHRRFAAYVEAHGLICQACGGYGHAPDSQYYGPGDPCGWCETTGKVTRWIRGQWLRCLRDEKRAARKRKAV